MISWGSLPEFDELSNLPPGIHDASIEEVKTRFVTNPHREKLFNELMEVLAILRGSNCAEVFLDGSFITGAETPGDYDLCYEPTPEFQEFLLSRQTRKER